MQASRQFLNYVAHTLGWRVAFLIVAALSALALLGVWLTVPQGVKTAPLNGASWRRVLTRQALMTVLLVTVLNGTGQFTFLHIPGAVVESIASRQRRTAYPCACLVRHRRDAGQRAGDACRGTARCTAIGAICASRHVWRFGGLGRSRGIIVGGAGGRDAVGPWYICRKFRSAGPVCRHCSRPAPRRPYALNTSAIYFGQAAGAGIGGKLIQAGMMPELPLAAAAILLAAAAVSIVAQQWER